MLCDRGQAVIPLNLFSHVRMGNHDTTRFWYSYKVTSVKRGNTLENHYQHLVMVKANTD